MAFQITPLQISQRQTDYGQLGTLAANIGQQFTSGLESGRKLQETARSQQDTDQKRALLAQLLRENPDIRKIGLGVAALGDISGGATLIGLGGKIGQAVQGGAGRTAGRGSAYLGGDANPGAAATARFSVPGQQVHVAENEADVQRLERATGMVTTDSDRDAIVRTVYGEADRESPEGQRAVAAVIRNRANQAGLTPEQITQQNDGRNWQFEPWGDPAARARMEAIPQRRFDQIAGTVAPVIEQGLDPTGGATHFYAPKAQAALGRPAPRWDDGTGTDLGNHRFFAHGYGPGGGAPAPSAATIIAQGGGEGPPVQAAQGGQRFLANEPPAAGRFTAPPAQVAPVPAQPGGVKVGPAGATIANETRGRPLVDDRDRDKIDTTFLSGILEANPKISQRLADMRGLSAAVGALPPGAITSRRVYLDRVGASIGLSPGELAAGSDEIDATVARLAPAEREEGANSTSGIEFKRLLEGLPGLAATQEGRGLIQSAIARQSKLHLKRSEIADQWDAGNLGPREARRLIAEIDRTSLFESQEERALFRKLAAPKDGGVRKEKQPNEKTIGGTTYIRRNGDWYPKEETAHGAAGH